MAQSNDDGSIMTAMERSRSSVLIVESDQNDRNNLRGAIKSLGFGGISDVASPAAALEKMEDRRFTHLIFEAREVTMPAKDFLANVLEAYPSIIAIPSSFEPSVDDVFDLLIMGAKGYLVKPFTTDTVDNAIINASKGDPISPAVLNAADRDEALVAILMGSLDRAATVMRQALQFETARREIPKLMAGMRCSAELAKTFCKGGDVGMLDALEKFCIERSKGPATRLGRLRKRLKTTRVGENGEEIEEDEEQHPAPGHQ